MDKQVEKSNARPKPQLRGMAMKRWTRVVQTGIVAACITAVAFKYLVAEPRKRHYEEFYKNFDADKEYQRQKAAGIFKGFEPS